MSNGCNHSSSSFTPTSGRSAPIPTRPTRKSWATLEAAASSSLAAPTTCRRLNPFSNNWGPARPSPVLTPAMSASSIWPPPPPRNWPRRFAPSTSIRPRLALAPPRPTPPSPPTRAATGSSSWAKPMNWPSSMTSSASSTRWDPRAQPPGSSRFVPQNRRRWPKCCPRRSSATTPLAAPRSGPRCRSMPKAERSSSPATPRNCRPSPPSSSSSTPRWGPAQTAA